MKKNISIPIIKLTFISVFCLGCQIDKFDFQDQVNALENLPGYVAFNAPGTSVAIESEEVTENDGSVEFNIEAPGGSTSDVTVNFSFSGNAIFGTDFTIEGASQSGGSIVLSVPTTPQQELVPINQDLVVNILTDNAVDGNKSLTITIESASNAEGSLSVGRGGLDILRRATVSISDVD